MGVISALNCIENEYNDVESNKSWKVLYTSLKTESEQLYTNITMNEAKKTKNKIRNRYRDVLPYDHSRVPLKCLGDNDYINASYVQLEDSKDQRRYILTQGPLISTVSHFWRMVWAERSTCIVMLNKLIEKDVAKCAQYFPVSENEVVCHEYTDFSLCLSLIEIVNKDAYLMRVMLLENKLTSEVRRITQYHYLSWPDFGVPSSPASFLEFLWDIRLSGGLSDPTRPSIIHCSAGIGRSGTFVIIDLALLQFFEKNNEEPDVDLQSMLLELRKCRMGLVQAPEQLKFAYAAIIMGAKSIIQFGDIKLINIPKLPSQSDITDNTAESESHDDTSSSGRETDSDFSDGSDMMHSNSALDNAAAAVRSRRGLPPTNMSEDTISPRQNNIDGMVELDANENQNLHKVKRASDTNNLTFNKTESDTSGIQIRMRRGSYEYFPPEDTALTPERSETVDGMIKRGQDEDPSLPDMKTDYDSDTNTVTDNKPQNHNTGLQIRLRFDNSNSHSSEDTNLTSERPNIVERIVDGDQDANYHHSLEIKEKFVSDPNTLIDDISHNITYSPEETFFISESNDGKAAEDPSSVDEVDSQIIQIRRNIREDRRNRTREDIDKLRSTIRRKALERSRLLNRFGLSRCKRFLTCHSLRIFLFEISVIICFISTFIGLIIYTYL